MSRKYIAQINNDNFVYPNYKLAEYDVEIVHDLNEYSVSGIVTNLSATTISSTAITLTFQWTWISNGAEPFILQGGSQSGFSVHILPPNQTYYKPWRLITYATVTKDTTSQSGTITFTTNPSNYGLTTFVTGIYYLEIRFVGHRAIFPVTAQLSITV
jgi:hypothetical protein